MKRIINLFILIFISLFCYLTVYNKINLDCILKKYTSIRCPGCGLTRGFRCILKLDFINAFKYNILSIPIFICILISFIILIYDIVNNSTKCIELFNRMTSKHYKLIILILIITMIINNINSI